MQSLGVKAIQDLDRSIFCVFLAEVIQTQKEKVQEVEMLYRLWFVLELNRSVFCWCKDGTDQGYVHLSATLFEPDNFL